MSVSSPDTSTIDTTLMPDVRSHLATYLNEHDMKFIKTDVLIDDNLHDYIVDCWYVSQYRWILEQYNKNTLVFSSADLYDMLQKECGKHSWTIYTCSYIAFHGTIEILELARTYGYKWNELSCYYAASCNNLEMLQWLRTNGCPWDKWTYVVALRNNHIEIMQWARDNGCPDI